MKKIVALILCFVMAAGLMAGCEKAMDLETLTKKMDEAALAVGASSSDLDMDLEMEISASGVTMSVEMEIDAVAKSQKEPTASYTDADN